MSSVLANNHVTCKKSKPYPYPSHVCLLRFNVYSCRSILYNAHL